MPSKVQLYAQMADRTAEQITGSYQKWTAFLTTAARLYKYPYNEQLMIFAQRPEATACAGYDLWNKQILRSRKPRAMSGWVLLWMSGTFITISRMKQSRWGICPAWVISIAPAFQRKRSV